MELVECGKLNWAEHLLAVLVMFCWYLKAAQAYISCFGCPIYRVCRLEQNRNMPIIDKLN
jgi:hypothetical protein